MLMDLERVLPRKSHAFDNFYEFAFSVYLNM